VLETPHVMVAAAIATATGNPLLAFPLSVASHFALDMVPHWNPHLNTDLKKYGNVSGVNKVIVFGDSLLALGAGLYIANTAMPDSYLAFTILLACLGSTLPDLIEAPHYFLKIRNPLIDKYIKWQKSIQNDTSIIPGVATQIITILISLWVIGRFLA